jgi:DNA-binding response OmpR family regulator
MLTVRHGLLDKVRALDFGADDYLTKPFDHLELFARLRALVRRATDAEVAPAPDFQSGDLTVDFTTHEVHLRGELVALSPTEHQLLVELVRHAGATLPHQRLLDCVWGADYPRDLRYLKVFVNRLRTKLGDDAAHPRYIQTVWGIGYRFLAPV